MNDLAVASKPNGEKAEAAALSLKGLAACVSASLASVLGGVLVRDVRVEVGAAPGLNEPVDGWNTGAEALRCSEPGMVFGNVNSGAARRRSLVMAMGDATTVVVVVLEMEMAGEATAVRDGDIAMFSWTATATSVPWAVAVLSGASTVVLASEDASLWLLAAVLLLQAELLFSSVVCPLFSALVAVVLLLLPVSLMEL